MGKPLIPWRANLRVFSLSRTLLEIMNQELQAVTKYRDPLRRLTATPLVADLAVMGRRVRLESNSDAIFGRITALFACSGSPSPTPPDFLWRLVGERNGGAGERWPEMAAFSNDGLRYVNLGQRNFFAIDLNAGKAIAFLSEELASDPIGFSSVFAATLFDMTASALGLVQFAAACVSLHGKALLVFGAPRSGKTTSAYLAGRLGLGFHSDQASYLDLRPNGLQVWGQFWPAAFRQESVQFLPELASATRSFTYGNLIFRCLSQQPYWAPQATPVTPVGCVLLERQTAKLPHLIPMAATERDDFLKNCFAFRDDARFAPQYAGVLRLLGKLPAYRLPYGDDPAVAATFFRSILSVHNSLEVTR
jgi:hypothetical protein